MMPVTTFTNTQRNPVVVFIEAPRDKAEAIFRHRFPQITDPKFTESNNLNEASQPFRTSEMSIKRLLRDRRGYIFIPSYDFTLEERLMTKYNPVKEQWIDANMA